MTSELMISENLQ